MKRLETKIVRLKEQISALGPLRPGSLSRQKRRARGAEYGEYWYLSYTFKGRGYTDYVPPELVKQVRAEIADYRRFKKLSEALLETSIELSRTRIKRFREARKS
jgi:hypothetical protein